LCEPALSADQNSVAGDNFPDATQIQFRKLFFPRVEQFHRAGARHREQQFKILAIGQRRDERWFGGELSFARNFAARLMEWPA